MHVDLVLPALVDEFKAVSVRIQHVGRVVARVVMQPRAWRAVVLGACRHGGNISRDYLVGAHSYEANMGRLPLRLASAKPEEYARVGSEALKIGMPWRAILSVVVEPFRDAKRCQGGGIESYGAIKITYREKDVIKHKKPAD